MLTVLPIAPTAAQDPAELARLFFAAHQARDQAEMERLVSGMAYPFSVVESLWLEDLRGRVDPQAPWVHLDAASDLARIAIDSGSDEGLQQFVAHLITNRCEELATKRLVAGAFRRFQQAGGHEQTAAIYQEEAERLDLSADDYMSALFHWHGAKAVFATRRYPEAAGALRRAANGFRAVHNDHRLVECLQILGIAEYYSNRSSTALAVWTEELSVRARINQPQMRCWLHLGNAHATLQEDEEAIACYREAIQEAEAAGHQETLELARNHLRDLEEGAIEVSPDAGLERVDELARLLDEAIAAGRTLDAARLAKEAKAIADSYQGPDWLAVVIAGYGVRRRFYESRSLANMVASCELSIAHVERVSGRLRAAEQRLLAVWKTLEATAPSAEAARACRQLGEVYLQLAARAESERWFTRSMELSRELGDACGVAGRQLSLAKLHLIDGDYDIARQWAESGLEWARAHEDAELEALALELIADIESALGNLGAALAQIDRALEILPGETSPSIRPGFVRAKAQLLTNAGDFAAARCCLEEHVAELRRSGSRKELAHALLYLGGYHQFLRHAPEAAVCLEEAHRLFLATGLRADALDAKRKLADQLMYTGETRRAVEAYREILEEIESSQLRMRVRLGLAEALADAEQFDEALAEAREALAFAAQQGSAIWESAALNTLGGVLKVSGHPEQALPLLRRAVELVEGREGFVTLHGRCRLTHVLFDLERYAEALASNRLLLETGAHFDRGLTDDELLPTREHNHLHSLLGVRAAAALLDESEPRSEPVEQLFWHLEYGRSLLLARDITNRAQVLAAHVPEPLVDAVRRARAEVRRAAAKAIALRQQPAPDLAAIEAVAGELRGTEVTLDAAVSAMRRSRWLASEIALPAPIGLEELRALLGRDTAYLAFQFLDDELCALFVDREVFAWRRLGSRDHVEELLELHARLVAMPVVSDVAVARQLGELLWEPFRSELAKVQRVWLSPDERLSFLPFDALVIADEGASRRLVERWELVMVPSATVVSALLQDAPERSGVGLLAVGDPVYELARGERDLDDVRSRGPEELQRLPGTAAEVRALAELFGPGRATVLLREEASVARLLGALSAVDGRLAVLHLACHGVFDPERPSRSGLVLSGLEVLSTYDLGLRRIPADLVVLSACRSGAGQLAAGEGVIGLARSFLLAGASSVLVSNWSIDDSETRDFMVRVYGHLVRDGMGPAAALRAARLELLRAGGQVAHPSRWAAFTLWGLPE
ncbi:MAG: CHAT domain-containing protein [Planctomycetes bacterium]|nr:CHAT domain-containing protein [Planctomycetota bacterium]